MGFWTFYVLPLCISFVLMLIGILGVSYIYAFVLELVTPSSLTKYGWMEFWNDNVIFVITTVVLIAINVLILRRSRKMQLKIR